MESADDGFLSTRLSWKHEHQIGKVVELGGVDCVDFAVAARELMSLAVLHHKELQRILETYPQTQKLLEEVELPHSLLSPQSPEQFSRRTSYDQSRQSHVQPQAALVVPLEIPQTQEPIEVPELKPGEASQASIQSATESTSPAPSSRQLRKLTSSVGATNKSSLRIDEGGQEESAYLDTASGIAVVLNAILIAFELECDGSVAGTYVGVSNPMRCQDAWPLFLVLEHVFTAFFIVELSIRFYQRRTRNCMDCFNIFDATVVLLSCVDLYILQLLLPQQVPLRVLRIFRLARVARLARLTKTFRGLRLLSSACASFLPSLGWSMVLLSLCMTIGGLAVGILLQDFIQDESKPLEDRKWIWTYYGTFYRAMCTMFEITFAGSWPSRVRPVLETVDHVYSIFFAGYITIVVFAVIRVITAIFLSQTLEAASNDIEIMIDERMRKKAILVERLEGIFQAIDESGDGLLSEDEMKDLLGEPKVQAYLESLDVALPESEALSRLLQNSDGEITYEDFIEGILRCKGPARAVDQVILQSELRSIHNGVEKLYKAMEEAKLIQTQMRRPKGPRTRKDRRLKSHLALLSSNRGEPRLKILHQNT